MFSWGIWSGSCSPGIPWPLPGTPGGFPTVSTGGGWKTAPAEDTGVSNALPRESFRESPTGRYTSSERCCMASRAFFSRSLPISAATLPSPKSIIAVAGLKNITPTPAEMSCAADL